MQHPNAKLTVRGRLDLVLFVDAEGNSFREAAAAFRCSVSTAFEWVARWRAASIMERRGLACLCDRSSRPHRQPCLMSPLAQARIVLARRRTGWGPRLVAGELGMAHWSTRTSRDLIGLTPDEARDAVSDEQPSEAHVVTGSRSHPRRL